MYRFKMSTKGEIFLFKFCFYHRMYIQVHKSIRLRNTLHLKFDEVEYFNLSVLYKIALFYAFYYKSQIVFVDCETPRYLTFSLIRLI